MLDRWQCVAFDTGLTRPCTGVASAPCGNPCGHSAQHVNYAFRFVLFHTHRTFPNGKGVSLRTAVHNARGACQQHYRQLLPAASGTFHGSFGQLRHATPQPTGAQCVCERVLAALFRGTSRCGVSNSTSVLVLVPPRKIQLCSSGKPPLVRSASVARAAHARVLRWLRGIPAKPSA